MSLIVQRGERLRGLRDLRCTNRGLAAALGCDEGTVRRDLRIEDLPLKHRAANDSGAAPDDFLRTPQDWEDQVDDFCRLLQESLDGSVSDGLAWNAVWLLSKYAVEDCLHPYKKEQLFEEVIFRFCARHGKIRSNWVPADWQYHYPHTRNRRNVRLVGLAQECLPQPTTDEEIGAFQHEIEALMKFVEQLENRLSIIDRGLQKARRICKCIDRDRHLNFMRQARNLDPDEYARMLRSQISKGNTVPNLPQ